MTVTAVVEGVLQISADHTTLGLLCAVSALLLITLWYISSVPREDAGLPPGPAGLPFIGVVPKLLKDPHLAFTEWAREFGDVVSFKLGPRRVVVLNTVEAVREAWVKHGDVTADRPSSFVIDVLGKNRGIGSTNGHVWKEQRRFALTTLKDFGMGKICLEQKILDEAEALVRTVEAEEGKPFDIHNILMTSVCNVIYSIVSGKRHENNDEELRRFSKRIGDITKHMVMQNMVLTPFPWLRFLPGDVFKYWQTIHNVDCIEKVLQDEIDQHKLTFDPAVTRDFIDAFLARMNEVNDGEETTFDNMQLRKVIGDLFVAGTETSATTLYWTMLFLLHNPDVQENLQVIDEVIGNGQISLRHRKDLVLVDATINEVLRSSHLAPIGVPHQSSEEITIGGYRIPPKTMIIANMWHIHSDPNRWENSSKFDAGRFMDPDGKLKVPDSYFPFSMGKRSCIGESLARMEIFLFLTCLLRNFKFVPEDPEHLPPLDGVVNLTREPFPFKIRAVKRTQGEQF